MSCPYFFRRSYRWWRAPDSPSIAQQSSRRSSSDLSESRHRLGSETRFRFQGERSNRRTVRRRPTLFARGHVGSSGTSSPSTPSHQGHHASRSPSPDPASGVGRDGPHPPSAVERGCSSARTRACLSSITRFRSIGTGSQASPYSASRTTPEPCSVFGEPETAGRSDPLSDPLGFDTDISVRRGS
jgi:hypothetical protein